MPIRLPYLWLSLLLLTGCANNSLMTPYPLRAGSYTHALGLGVLAPAVADARRITAGGQHPDVPDRSHSSTRDHCAQRETHAIAAHA